MCVVLGVSVISVFDAVAFLAYAHRVSSAENKTGTGTTYGSQGQPMDINRLCREGKCFWCGKKGHLSKDCPNKAPPKETIQAIDTEPATESKVKEEKDNAGK